MISAVGQMLGAIGVIISIIYLAAQIRNQNKESQRAAMNVLTTHWSDLNRTLVENPEMAVLWLRALRSFDDRDAKSKLRFGAHLGRFLRFADSLYLNFLDGTLDKRSIQITPVCSQNIHRCALALLVLVPDLSGQIDDRNNDSDSAQHLSDGADHLPVHTCWLMNDGTKS